MHCRDCPQISPRLFVMTPDPTLIEQVKRLLDIWDAAPRGAITDEQGAAHAELCNMGPELARALLTLQGSAALPSEAITDEMIEAGCVAYFHFRHTIESDVLFRDLATEEQEDFVRRVYTAMRATTPTAPIEGSGALSGSHASTEPCGLGPSGFDPARIELALRVMRLFDSFDGPSTDNLWWRTDGEYAPVTMLVNCNDLFLWGCADCEVITTENIAALEATIAEVAKVGEYLEDTAVLLWCCRERQLRPQPPYYKSIDKRLWPLFDACGPNADTAGRLHRPAIATEAGTAETPQSGSVHEGAGPEDIAHD